MDKWSNWHNASNLVDIKKKLESYFKTAILFKVQLMTLVLWKFFNVQVLVSLWSSKCLHFLPQANAFGQKWKLCNQIDNSNISLPLSPKCKYGVWDSRSELVVSVILLQNLKIPPISWLQVQIWKQTIQSDISFISEWMNEWMFNETPASFISECSRSPVV